VKELSISIFSIDSNNSLCYDIFKKQTTKDAKMLQVIKSMLLGSVIVFGFSAGVISLAAYSVHDAEMRYSKLVK
jgi:hypothetical protein